jgi:hypothetical protein
MSRTVEMQGKQSEKFLEFEHPNNIPNTQNTHAKCILEQQRIKKQKINKKHRFNSHIPQNKENIKNTMRNKMYP